MSEKISARDLHRKFFDDSEQLSNRELFLDGEWRQIIEADVQRRPGSPLYLYVELPEGGPAEFQVPYDSEVLIRDKPSMH